VIVESHPQTYRHDQVWGDSFDSRESYAHTHPEVQLVRRGDMSFYPYFEASRVPTLADLCGHVAPQDAVTRLLVNADIPPAEIAVALAYLEKCGSSRFQEIYRTRPLWALYLAATNISGTLIPLASIIGDQELPNDLGYRPFGQRRIETSHCQALPKAPLPPNATLLVPVATLLGPLTSATLPSLAETFKYLPSGQGQVVAHQDLSLARSGASVIGPAIWPRTIRLRRGSADEEQVLHEFDLANLYTISRFWEAGSCPHLFTASTKPRGIRYIQELFGQQPGQMKVERFVVPDGTRKLIVAELEVETTWIESIRVNGIRHTAGLHLDQGDTLVITVQPGDRVEFVGYYVTKNPTLISPWERNCLVAGFQNAGDILLTASRKTR
jgi:hypothetical protein